MKEGKKMKLGFLFSDLSSFVGLVLSKKENGK